MCWSLECFEEFSGLQQCLSYVPMRVGRGGAEAASSPAGEGFLAATAPASAAGAWQCMTSHVDTKKQAIGGKNNPEHSAYQKRTCIES